MQDEPLAVQSISDAQDTSATAGADENPSGPSVSISQAQLAPQLRAALDRQVGPTDDVGQELAQALIRDARSNRVTDIHIDPQRYEALLRFRIDGAMVDILALSEAQARRIINQLKTLSDVDPVALQHPTEARFSLEVDDHQLDLRLLAAPAVSGEKLTLRLLDAQQVDHRLDTLGLTSDMVAQVEQWVHNVNGMVLATGPTGSGKTTTLYALLQQLRQPNRSVVTLEDPVEYQTDHATQLQVDDASGFDYALGLKTMMRLDPDYLLIGEIRDKTSAWTATSAASSGHVVLSTLHSPDPISVITSLRAWDVPAQDIAATLQLVVSQRLIRRLCEACRTPAAPAPRERRWLEGAGLEVPANVHHAQGCESCRQLGYRGRVGVFELWRLTEDDLDLVVEDASEQRLRRHLRERGHRTLLQDANEKACAGETTIEELMGARLVPRLV